MRSHVTAGSVRHRPTFVARHGLATERLAHQSPKLVGTISHWFNALNVNLWRRADSADWTDEETGESLLNGLRRSSRTSCVSFAKVRVAGLNPVVRSI